MSEITRTLTPMEGVAIIRARDRWPMAEKLPDGLADVETKINEVLANNPTAAELVQAILSTVPGYK